jgi:hypothetical protein
MQFQRQLQLGIARVVACSPCILWHAASSSRALAPELVAGWLLSAACAVLLQVFEGIRDFIVQAVELKVR